MAAALGSALPIARGGSCVLARATSMGVMANSKNKARATARAATLRPRGPCGPFWVAQPMRAIGSLEGLQNFQQLGPIRHLADLMHFNVADDALLVDDKGGALGVALGTQDAVLLGHIAVR